MKRLPSEPTRLHELHPQSDPANLARLVRSATKAPPEPLLRLKGRIRYTLRRRSLSRRRYLRFALVGAVLFLTGGVVGAVVQPILHRWQQPKVESAEDVHPAPAASRARHRRTTPPSSRAADEVARSADQTVDPVVSPPVAVPSAQTSEGAAPSEPRMAPAVGLAEPRLLPPAPTTALPRTSTRREPRIPAPATGRLAAAPLPSHPAGPAPVQTAMLEPPRQPAQAARATAWPAPAETSRPHGSATPVTPLPAPLPEGPLARPLGTAGTSLPAPSTPPAVVAKPVAPPPPSEQALLSRAVRSLRAEHRPASALAVLDEYAVRFPNGSLHPEATRLRTEALLALGEKPAALAELNRETAPGATGGEESLLVRGELRAAVGRWQEALDDFEAVVRARLANEPSLGPATSIKLRERFERALWGRASARSHLGNDAGARADLREYLRRFPQGRFATQAARLLGELR